MKNFLLLIALVTTQVLGDIWLSRAMKQFGEVTSFSPRELMELVGYLFASPWIWLGVCTLTFSMLLYLNAISKLNVSYVLPIHASSYVLNSFMAWIILGEDVSNVRFFGTIIIGLGVLIVGISQTPKKTPDLSKRKKFRKPDPRFLFFLPFSLDLSKIWMGVLVMALADSTGDMLTAAAMKQVGISSSQSLSGVISWVKRVFTHPLIIGGAACYTISFFLFISLLSWADISLIRPASAIGYVTSMVGARYVLMEKISPTRLIGIIVIGLGVTIISLTS